MYRDAPLTSSQRFAAVLAPECDMSVIGLRVWDQQVDDAYDMRIETAAVQRAASDRGWTRYHLYGFSAGATVALATALTDPDAIRSIVLFEPATIGDDVWGPRELQWREQLTHIRRLTPDQRQPAFRQLLVGAQEQLPSTQTPAAPWDALTDKLEDLLARVGFNSESLSRITQPTLVLSGAQSNPRFSDLADRLVQVMPHATAKLIPDCSHLDPPQRSATDQLARELLQFWAGSLK
jgi:pimeloyl-ACP methyl ester carboxylesterase